jgi:hypothetical protein
MASRRRMGAMALMALAALAWGGCGADDPRDNLGEEGVRPPGSQGLVDDAELDAMIAGGTDVYFGDEPPRVDGVFFAEDLWISQDEELPNLIGNTVVDAWITIEDLGGGEVSVVIAQDSDADVIEGMGGFISGHGSCFTLYVDASTVHSDCEIEQVNLISGCLVNGDIHYFQYSAVYTDYLGGDCDEGVRGLGYLRIIETDTPAWRL